MTTNFDKAQSQTGDQAPRTRRVRVPRAPVVGNAPLDMGHEEGVPGGIRLTKRYVERDGRPWFPVMGEYHFSRDLPERWETELRKMKAGGIGIVATYLLWIVHEEVRGEVRWDGHRDLRRFVETADRVGLKVLIRIGPWAHGETRNGGFPDWLQALPIAHRTNDPGYLELARGWYAAIEEQVRGLFHSEHDPAGPVIGVQVDNELYDQPDHLGRLRALAEEVGMRAPLWVATGWGGAELPKGALLPVYAGYSDGFWEESTTGWPHFGVMHFTFTTVRDDLSVGADLRDAPVSAGNEAALGADDPWPFATCELGGGMQVAYHRRPLVDPEDVSALALTKLGSGSAWQGYYLYHGATQVVGALSTTQESHATGYPNDLPVRDYDFFAPLGAEGGERAHFHRLRRQHLLLDAFGPTIATYPTVLPQGGDTVRWAVRGDGERGYLFVNNQQPALAALADVDGVRFEVEFSERTVTVPSAPFTLRSGVHAAWPLRQRLGGIPALTATAQPITRIDTPRGPVILFAATEGVGVELQLEGVTADTVRGAELRDEGDVLIAVPTSAPGLGAEVVVGDTTLVFLDPATADAVWKGEVDGRESVVVWRGSGWFDGGFRYVAQAHDGVLDVFPPLRGGGLTEVPGEGTVFTRYAVPGEDVSVPVPAPVFDIAALAPVRTGGSVGRLSAPDDDDFAALAPVEVPVDDALFDDAERLLLRLDWTGDAVRVYAGDRLIADQFWYGRDVEVDLAPYREEIRASGLWLRAFAWAPDSGVYVDPRVRPDASAPVLQVREASLTAVRSRSVR
ncbi:beta-galactosidase [Allonocardiopsis opalescens]|uniref:beta-galactosidase n=1 Tax=Allonocardiopsis opalescens TaxID=1144618 RepID=UPI001475A321|nr:beta-galactosidase [Allonocardiopsis opalescens]